MNGIFVHLRAFKRLKHRTETDSTVATSTWRLKLLHAVMKKNYVEQWARRLDETLSKRPSEPTRSSHGSDTVLRTPQ